ncbi:FHA domain-containing protein [Devosia sp. CN2-171]|uniref:FHA domain-containing protein n=1 Tax=Devosia sp. CN2-171 TaxID=3400909 RepID=UPI003BF912B1
MTILTVGRHSDCEIILDHPTISRRHAEVQAVAGGKFTIQDTDSAGGTFVRDGDIWRRVRKQTVSLRDVLRFGEYEIGVAELLEKIDPSVTLQFGASEAAPVRRAAGANSEPKKPEVGGRFERDPATGLIMKKH